MKNIFKSLMLVAVAAMGFACQEKMEDFTPERANEVVMTITADVEETRTVISDEANGKVAWSAGDQIKVIENGAIYRTSGAAVIDGDGKAKFAVSFPEKAGAVTYNAVFPANAVIEEAEVKADQVQVAVKSFQYPAEASFDPQADVLVAKQLEYNAQPTELNMQFKRLVALGKMTLTNIETDAAITKVIFSVEDKVLAGRNIVNTTTGEVEEYGYDAATSAITLNYEGNTSNVIYFTCNPFELVAGDTFKVTVICADQTAYVREVELNKTLTFTAGNMSKFSVNMKGTAVSVGSGKTGWNLVKDASDLAVGDQIIIAANDYNVAISTTQNNNNRGQVDITKSGETLVDLSASVQILTLTKGINDNTFGLYTGSGYLYAASNSSNYLKTQTSNNANGSWSISIAETGAATIKATGSYTRNVMQYNQSSKLFACYASASQKALVIYKNYVDGGNSEIEIPKKPSFSLDVESLEFDEKGGSKEINVVAENNFYGAVTATTDAEWLTIENDDYTFTITADENEGFARTANVVFSADGCEDIKVAVSQDANPNAAIEATVAEFLAAKESDTTLYRLRGTITNVAETSFGNFDLTDETGTVYIYGLCSPEGETKYWAASGAQLGDDIEIITVRSSYSNTPQGKNATFVEKQRPGTIAFWSFEKTSASFTDEGGVVEIKVAAYNLKEDIALEFKAGEDGDLFKADYADGVLTISAAANSSTDELNATLYVRSGDLEQVITISQAAYVEPGEGGDEPAVVEKTATLSFANTAQRTTFTTSQQVWEQNGITLTNDKGSSTSNVADYSNPARFYKSSKITVDAPGYMKSITFVCNSSSYATTLESSITSSSNYTVTVSGANVTVDFTSASSSQFVIASLTGGQVRMNSLSVTYMGKEE